MTDPIAAAREWLEAQKAGVFDTSETARIVRPLLAEIERLKEHSYAALKRDTDRRIIADSEQYTRGYDKAIKDAMDACVERALSWRGSGRPVSGDYYHAARIIEDAIATLRKGGKDELHNKNH